METSWSRTKGRSDIWIADLDTGINANHPDLQGKIAINSANLMPLGYDYIGENVVPKWQDLHGHGTFVSGMSQ